MAVKIRLSRIGKKHMPFYRIVALDSRKKRDGAFLEDLGTYDALHTSIVTFNNEGIMDWVAKGAVLTDSVKKIQKLYLSGNKEQAAVASVKAPKKAQTEAVAEQN